MKNKHLVSIVIPTYNVENYIEKCLCSILSQTYERLQVIVVDDLSTDKTCEIVEDFVLKDNRVTLYRLQKNSGSAFARQFGIDHSDGEYLTFVDSDDWYNSCVAIETAINSFDTHTDCVMFGYRTIHTPLVLKKQFASKRKSYTAAEVYMDKLKRTHVPHWHYLWNKIYRLKLIKECVKFDVNLRRAEDVKFNIDFLRVANIITVIPELFYDYNCSNPGQITRSNVSQQPTVKSLMEYSRHLSTELHSNICDARHYGVYDTAERLLYKGYYKSTVKLMSRLSLLKDGESICNEIVTSKYYIKSLSVIGYTRFLVRIEIAVDGVIMKLRSIVKNLIKR